MKKVITILLLIVVALGVIFAAAMVYGRYSSMSEMRIDRPDIPLGPLPLSDENFGEILPGMPFRIDTGSSANTISREYVDRLKKMGYQVDSSYVLTLVRNLGLGFRLTTKRYRISLPVYAYDITRLKDNVVKARIDTFNRVNMVHGIDFVPTNDENDRPCFGRPFISQFFMEYDYEIRSVRFHPTLPEGYEETAGLRREKSMFYEPSLLFDIKVNEEPIELYLNTAMPRVGILKTLREAPEINNVTVFADTIHSSYGEYPAVIDYGVWVEWNDRAGRNVCYYSDYGYRDYAINPFNFLTQDAVFDIANGRVYLRPYSKKARRTRQTDVYAQSLIE